MQINDKNIILTGAASGIGHAVLELLAEYPARILAVDLNAEALQAACTALAGMKAQITAYPCDLSEQANVDRLFNFAVEKFGKVDLFIANAGFAYFEQIVNADWAHIEKIFRVNVFSGLYALEKMQVLNGKKPYKVVITASAMAHIAVPGYALYSATKAALDRFADAYRWQLDDGRKLMLVYPIATRTKFFKAAGDGVPTPWPSQKPEVVAKAIIHGIRTDKRAVYPSFIFSLVLFFKRFLPMHWVVQRLEMRRFGKWLKRK